MERLGGDRRQGDEPVRARQRAGGQAEAVHHGRDQDLRSRAGRLYDVVALSGNRSLYEGVLDWSWLGVALGLSYVQIALDTSEYISFGHSMFFIGIVNLLQRKQILQVTKSTLWAVGILPLVLRGSHRRGGICIVWVHILDFGNPMPFTGQVLAFFMYFIFWPIFFWFLFPAGMREYNTCTRKQILAFMWMIVIRTLMGLGYTKLPSLLNFFKGNMQWVIGILLPMLKKFNTWWLLKLTCRDSCRSGGGASISANSTG